MVGLQGMSETFSTLHGLVNKGVNVVMDIPFELWNETSAEVADLKKQVTNRIVVEALFVYFVFSRKRTTYILYSISVYVCVLSVFVE